MKAKPKKSKMTGKRYTCTIDVVDPLASGGKI